MNAPAAPRLLAGPAGRALAVLTAINLLNYLDRFVVSALVESLRADMWLTDTRLGWLMTGFIVVYMLASPFFGRSRSRPFSSCARRSVPRSVELSR